MKKQFFIEIIAFLLSLLFLYAGMMKLLDFQKFTVQIDQSPLLTGYGSVLPSLVIVSEFLIALALWIPAFRLYAFLSAFSLMTMFTVYIGAILEFADYIPCSCGGILELLSWREHLLFNACFMLIAALGVLLQSAVFKNGITNSTAS